MGSYIYIYTHNFVYNYIPGIYLFLWMDKKERYPSELWIEMTEIRETGAYWRRTGWKLVEKKRRQPDARAPWSFPTEEQTDHHERITRNGRGRILNMWSLDDVTCGYLENGISSPSLSGCKNPLPLSLNSDPLFVIICTQSLQSLVIAQRCP